MDQAQRKAQSLYNKALQFHQKGKIEQAEKLYREILQDFPTLTPVIQNLGIILQETGRATGAIPLYLNGIVANPTDVGLLNGLSAALAENGQVREAIRYGEQAVRQQPGHGESLYNLANLYNRAGQTESALTHYNKALAIIPNLAPAHYNKGIVLVRRGDRTAARDAFEKAVDFAPEMIEAHLNLGVLALDAGDFKGAEAHFQRADAIRPGYGPTAKSRGLLQQAMGNNEAAVELFAEAGKTLPEDRELLTNWGNALKDLGQLAGAEAKYRQVLELYPEDVLARRNLKRLKNRLIPRWHFEMLADSARNDAYNEAIRAVVKDKIVLDIGTGSGLLAMMAARAGARHVYACEMVPELATVARDIVARNGFADKITVISKRSTQLEIGEDLPEKAQVLISEILDVGLLGEGVIPTVRHARRHLLVPQATVIPQSAELKAVLVESAYLAAMHPVGEIAGFDLSTMDEFQVEGEYSRILLDHFPHRLLSEEFSLGSIDLSNPGSPVSVEYPRIRPIEVTITADGIPAGVCFWFELRIAEQIIRSGGPGGEMLHWGQAWYPIHRNEKVQEGDIFALKILQSDEMIRFE